jgi:hypothetical protein
MDMNTLQHQFYGVMHKYQIAFSERGVRANLNKWWGGKRELYELLRRHPNWDEQELAVVFRFSEERELDHNIVDEAKFEMMELARECGLNGAELANFETALNAATASYNRIPEERYLNTISRYGGITCAAGQKASRIINKLCLHFGLDRLTREKVDTDETGNSVTRTIHPYNAVFARLADSLNPVHIPKTGVLSIHPCDFLEMSNRDNTWHSCHCLADGGWRSGCSSYMGDSVSMIFFTVDETVTADFHKVPRITREIFCYREGLLLQSRLYPTDDAGQRDLYRNLVQRAVADCLGMPNLWAVKNKSDECRDFLETAKHSHHYTDYYHGYAVLSFLKGWEKEYKPMMIGTTTLCPCCGEPTGYKGDLTCGSCEPVILCKECGQEIPKNTARYVDDAYYCHACRPICSECGRVIRSEVYTATDQNGNEVILCEDCHTTAVEHCQECSIRAVCKDLLAIRFCPQTNILANAA